MRCHLHSTVMLLLLAPLSAQVIGIDSIFTTGWPRSDLFGPTANGHTSVHFYPASRLKVSGVCANSQLIDLAIAPDLGMPTGLSGVFRCNSALIQIGHVTVSPPVPGNWNTNLDQPVTAFAPAQGLFSLPWVTNEWASLPGVKRYCSKKLMMSSLVWRMQPGSGSISMWMQWPVEASSRAR